MAEDIIRVLRLVEYEGPRSLVEAQVQNSIHGTRSGHASRDWPRGVRITAVTINEYPEIIEAARVVPDPEAMEALKRDLELYRATEKRNG